MEKTGQPKSLKSTNKKLQYARLQRNKQKELGLCLLGSCKNFPAVDRTLCEKHLRYLVEKVKERRQKRLASSLCIHCGKRPHLLGIQECVMCNPAGPLTNKIRNLIRTFWDKEKQNRREFEIEKFLSENEEFLSKLDSREYQMVTGVLNGLSLTHLGKQWGVSRERVRQIVKSATQQDSFIKFVKSFGD